MNNSGSGVYLFGLGRGWLPEKADKVARKHGARLVNYQEPGRGGEKRHWFTSANLGHPFDEARASTVFQALAEEGIIGSDA